MPMVNGKRTHTSNQDHHMDRRALVLTTWLFRSCVLYGKLYVLKQTGKLETIMVF